MPQSTLQTRVMGKATGSKYVSGRKLYLPEAAETELASMVKLLSKRGFPLTKREVKKLAYDFAKTI